jgi:hypothetical protein
LLDVSLVQDFEDFAHAGDNVRLTPIASTEQDQTWFGRLSNRKQAREVEVGGDDSAPFAPCVCDDLFVMGPA